jgi:hypothetical protein
MTDTSKRPVSPVNGQPLPRGKPFTKDDERAKNAGKKSGKTRGERKTLREDLLTLLKEEITDKNSGRTMGTQAALSAALIKQALSGNTKAYEIIRDTIGEKPVENVNIVSADFSALDAAFQGLSGGDAE